MVGDYISCSVVDGKGVALFAVGKTPTNGQAFDEAMYTAGPLAITGGALRNRATALTSPSTTATPARLPTAR